MPRRVDPINVVLLTTWGYFNWCGLEPVDGGKQQLVAWHAGESGGVFVSLAPAVSQGASPFRPPELK